ncbi:hypothetical protein ACSBR1_008482 [Camellia fascicularis]
MEFPAGVRQIVDEAGFDLFCMGLSRLITSSPLLGALVERWWDTTNSFHFSTMGEMMMTPHDFAMLTGIEVGGRSIPYDTDMGEWEAAWIYLFGARPCIFWSGMVRYTWFSEHFRGTDLENLEEIEQYARGFLMFLFGTTLFADRANTVGLYLLSALVDLSQVWLYDWGGTGLATLYGYMSSTSRKSGNKIGGYWRAWEPEVEMPHVVPYSHRYDDMCVRRTRETFLFFRRYFDTVTPAEVVPMLPLPSMRATESLSSQEVINFTRGVDADYFLGEGDYATFIQTHLMLLLMELLTELTCWRYTREAYQIPIEPPAAGHRYIRAPDSPPIYRGSARAVGLIREHDLDEGGTAQLPKHSGNFFSFLAFQSSNFH